MISREDKRSMPRELTVRGTRYAYSPEYNQYVRLSERGKGIYGSDVAVVRSEAHGEALREEAETRRQIL